MNFLVYRDVFGDWRWEFRQANGDYIDSNQAYESPGDCAMAAKKFVAAYVDLACPVAAPVNGRPQDGAERSAQREAELYSL
jgi:uncharacterized protein YegP (UPF0339 family)